ncbi:MAG: hypothetical protein K9J76_02075 [Polaromonas sp.]|nr:hypothetical protein [Polaromonas sp.]
MKQQRGATLIMALIMLVVMTLAAVLSYNLGKSGLQIVGNQQARQLTNSAARQAVELILTRDLFSVTPAAAFGTGNVADVDLFTGAVAPVASTSAQSSDKVRVQLAPAPCIRRSIDVAVTDVTDPAVQACIRGVSQNFGVDQANGSGSDCIDVIWEITATASDPVTNAATTVVQGVALRQDKGAGMNLANYCS